MKMLKLNYYHGRIYEKYKISNVLSLLVDKHKFQNDSIDFNEISNMKNNYSIMALLGSQIKNINNDIYKDIDTNDIILALSTLKKVDEQIVINESRNKNYILELAEQMYYEYSQKGLITNDSTFNLNDKRSIMNINLEIMNDINNQIKNYEGKIRKLLSYSEDHLKRDALLHYNGIGTNDESDKFSSILGENDMYYNMKQNKYLDRDRSILNKDLYDDNNINNYENYVNLKNEKRHSTTLPNVYDNYSYRYRAHLNNNNSTARNGNTNGSNLHYYAKEGTNSTQCNSVENVNGDVNVYSNGSNNNNHGMKHNICKNSSTSVSSNLNSNVKNNSNTYHQRRSSCDNVSHYDSGEKNIFNDRMKMNYLNRKTHYEKTDEEDLYENNHRSTIIGTAHHFTNRISNEYIMNRKDLYDARGNNKIRSDVSEYSNMNYNYDEKNKNLLNKDEMSYDGNNAEFKVGINSNNSNDDGNNMSGNNIIGNHVSGINSDHNNNNGAAYNSIYNIRLKKDRSPNNTIFDKNKISTWNSNVLANIDKAEKEIVNNHLKNSMTRNDYAARRMSSILLSPNVQQRELLFSKRKSYEKPSIEKFINRNSHNYNSDISLNKYSTLGQRKNYTSDTNNNSSFIISSANKQNMLEEDSFNVVGDFDNNHFLPKSKINYLRENYLSDNKYMNYPMSERNNNSSTPLNTDNLSNFSRNVHKSVESNLNMYTNKYSRALDINDLNSNTSRNYVNSSNSLKSDRTTMRDNYEKMFERSKSLTSNIYRVPVTHTYLRANM
ncbi:conserved Plasmodium protein, unknown function [Plasmodium malariae]|uniref:Uncharacterized protein n=1 Tax=Plasmodium malariae TaxID=5858 RepID=A0A1C3KYN9_PLAMA|nr:conserved Plasmodium protein, unknown function [Plasmodium malariae]